MKLVKPSAKIIEQQPGLEGIYKQIELAGRTCYKSEDKITEDSAKAFVDRMIKSGHCYTGESEVLTDKGWIKWKDYNNEKIAVIDKDLNFIGYEIPNNVIRKEYSGKFYEYGELGLKVTDGHKMFGVFRSSKNDFYNNNCYEKFTCNELYIDNNGRHKTLGERMFKSPACCRQIDKTDPYCELIGFWLGDGVHTEDIANKLKFRLKKKRKIEYLQSLCNKLNYTFEENKSDYYSVCYDRIGKIFNDRYYSNGNKSIFDFELSPLEIHSIIVGLINSDGSSQEFANLNTKTIKISNTSQNILEWICRLGPLAGYNVSYVELGDPINVNQNHSNYINLKVSRYIINNDSRKKDKKVRITEETLPVYCVSVSTGLIMVRGTNGQTSICGNCAMLEHGTVYLKAIDWDYNPLRHYWTNKYSRVKEIHLETEHCQSDTSYKYAYYVTTNLRVLVENGWINDLKYLCEPTEYHAKRVTFNLVCDRGVSHELVRHRVFSFAQESTRYCNYSKDKFGNEITFIKPSWFKENQLPLDCKVAQSSDTNGAVFYERPYKAYLDDIDADGFNWYKEDFFIHSCQTAEQCYLLMLEEGATPQEARQVLPNALKTELCMTGFDENWNNFFDLRYFESTGKVHPDMKELTTIMYKEYEKNRSKN